jgi:hypothetical protein
MKTVLAAVALASMLALATGCVITSDDDSCTAADNYCSDPWYLNYCVDATMYGSDCNLSCTSAPLVYGQTCTGTPGVAGECDDIGGVCVCYCEDSFDQCLDNDTIQYTRDGLTYTLSCKDYCNGPCDAAAGACSC